MSGKYTLEQAQQLSDDRLRKLHDELAVRFIGHFADDAQEYVRERCYDLGIPPNLITTDIPNKTVMKTPRALVPFFVASELVAGMFSSSFQEADTGYSYLPAGHSFLEQLASGVSASGGSLQIPFVQLSSYQAPTTSISALYASATRN